MCCILNWQNAVWYILTVDFKFPLFGGVTMNNFFYFSFDKCVASSSFEAFERQIITKNNVLVGNWRSLSICSTIFLLSRLKLKYQSGLTRSSHSKYLMIPFVVSLVVSGSIFREIYLFYPFTVFTHYKYQC